MATLPTLFLAEDKTGALAANRRVSEPHFAPSRAVRVIKPDFSPFYTRNLLLESVLASGQRIELIRGAHYTCVEFSTLATQKSGLEVCCAILVHDAALSEMFEITYQAFGGSANADLTTVATLVRDLSVAGRPVDWDDVLDKPRRVTPTPGHPHDAADLYGAEYLSDQIKRLQVASEMGQQDQNAALSADVAGMVNKAHSSERVLRDEIDTHLGDQANPHQVTKEQVGLSSLENRAFSKVRRNQVFIEPYSSPKSVSRDIDRLLAQGMGQHLLNQANPHATSAQHIALERVINLNLFTGYNFADGAFTAQSSYNAQYLSQSLPSYISAYSAAGFVQEYSTRYTNLKYWAPLSAYTAPNVGIFAQTQTLIDVTSDKLAALNADTSTIATSLDNTTAALADFEIESRAYRLLNFNACASEMLAQLVTHLYTVSAQLYPVPVKIPGLMCWLDFSDATKVTTQLDGSETTVKTITDKSTYGRVFSALSPSTAPRWLPSAQVSFAGKKVALFTSGLQHLDQTSGAPLALKPGMTAIVLTRTGADATALWVLSETSKALGSQASAGVCIKGAQGRALRLTGSAAWELIAAPQSSAPAMSAALSVASVSGSTEGETWLATLVTPDLGLNPLGYASAAIPSTQELSINAFSPLGRIGGDDATLAQAGELAEVILYARQLSKREILAVVTYLRLKWGSADLALDLTFVENAFAAT